MSEPSHPFTEEALDKYIGSRIRLARQLRSLTQAELGDLIGVRFQQIQKYETALNRTASARLWRIAEACAFPINFFYPAEEDQQLDDAIRIWNLPDKVNAKSAHLLVQHFCDANPELQTATLTLLRAAVGKETQ